MAEGQKGGKKMNQWVQFFLGTPQRFCVTALVVGLITVMVFPELLAVAIERLLVAMMPLMAPALTVLIVLAGIRMMFGSNKKN